MTKQAIIVDLTVEQMDFLFDNCPDAIAHSLNGNGENHGVSVSLYQKHEGQLTDTGFWVTASNLVNLALASTQNKEWLVNFKDSGWNTVMAKNEAEAKDKLKVKLGSSYAKLNLSTLRVASEGAVSNLMSMAH